MAKKVYRYFYRYQDGREFCSLRSPSETKYAVKFDATVLFYGKLEEAQRSLAAWRRNYPDAYIDTVEHFHTIEVLERNHNR